MSQETSQSDENKNSRSQDANNDQAKIEYYEQLYEKYEQALMENEKLRTLLSRQEEHKEESANLFLNTHYPDYTYALYTQALLRIAVVSLAIFLFKKEISWWLAITIFLFYYLAEMRDLKNKLDIAREVTRQ